MKKTTLLLMVCLSMILTACGKQSEIPPVDLIEIPVSTTETEIPPQTETPSSIPASSDIVETETITETSIEVTETVSLAETVASTTTLPETTQPPEKDSEEETETTTEAKPKNTSWVKAYRKVLAEHCEDSEEESETSDEDFEDDEDFDDDYEDDKENDADNEWFVLIYLDDDNIPELVILDDTDMELYCFDGKNAQLLLEDSYKSDALDGQNVCYQPYTGYIASAFTTMSGGDGFTIYHFDQLDAVHVQRYYFNNIENEEGEMAYNEIWDRADEFEVIDNGYHDVTLGDSWTHITSEMEGAFRLNSENVNTLTADLAPDIEYPTEEDPTEETKEDEE